MNRIAWVFRAVDSGNPVRRLLLASALMLFLELALIRWLGANIVHLSYFSNFVLLGSFLGIGLGFLISRKTWSVLPWTGPLLAVLAVATLLFPVSIQRQGSDVIYFTAMKVSGPPAWLALPVGFLLVAGTLARAPQAGGLPARGGPARRPRGGGRSMLRRPAAAHGLPLRPARVAHRDRLVHA